MWIYLNTILLIVAYFPLQITMGYTHLHVFTPKMFYPILSGNSDLGFQFKLNLDLNLI